MQLISSLIVIVVGVVLVGQASAGGEKRAQDLIDHQPESDTLSREQLIENLERLKLGNPRPASSEQAKYVAKQLYQTKNKPSTELYNGVTVQRLIEENRIDLEGCSEKAFSKRSELYLRTRPFGTQSKGVDFGINLYALTVLRSAVKYCLENKAAVVRGSINSEEYLQKLAGANEEEIKNFNVYTSDEGVLNEMLINGAYMSELAGAIEGSERQASKREHRLRTPERKAQYYEYE